MSEPPESWRRTATKGLGWGAAGGELSWTSDAAGRYPAKFGHGAQRSSRADKPALRPFRRRSTTPALAAVIDAIAELGVHHIEMPATPERVWHAIRAAAAGRM
jgi:hypothetical protein